MNHSVDHSELQKQEEKLLKQIKQLTEEQADLKQHNNNLVKTLVKIRYSSCELAHLSAVQKQDVIINQFNISKQQFDEFMGSAK